MRQYSTNSWNPLSLTYNEDIEKAILQMHHAAQFVAMFGEAFLPKASDDSQSNMQWLPKLQALVSHHVDRYHTGMTYDDWNLLLIGANDLQLGSIDPVGKNKDDIMDWFEFQLHKTPFAPAEYKYFSHFSLPDHNLDAGMSFEPIPEEIRHELARYRQNAHWILNQVTMPFTRATAVRTWPHHFDTGSVIALEFAEDDGSPTATIGVGWAIADETIEQPYFYINHWKKEGKINYDNLPKLPNGSQWHQGSWTGPILPLQSLTKLDGQAQYKLTKTFFEKGIAASRELLQP